MRQNVLIIGGGGREHALAWKLLQSPRIGRVFVAPGNGGTGQIAQNVPISIGDIGALLNFAKVNAIDLTVVGSEDSLALGIVDIFRAEGLRIFGPTQAAALLETSKAFAKDVMNKTGIPTAAYRIFSNHDKARAHIILHGVPVVIKVDGLALGKGVYVCQTLDTAKKALQAIMVDRIYGNAGDEVVIEEFLVGQEVSLHAFCDGNTFSLFPSAQDHKPLGDGDKGPNTGGMGAFAPVPWIVSGDLIEAGEKIIRPILTTLANRSRPFSGVLYPGVMMTSEGPKVLEFNSRFGDPETQVYMRLLKTDLLDILEACIDGKLAQVKIAWNAGFAVCVVLASGEYPWPYKKGIPIYGIDQAENMPGVTVFHAGTACHDGKFVTSGGRVLGVTAVANTLRGAIASAYKAVESIHFEGMQYRRDIGAKANV